MFFLTGGLAWTGPAGKKIENKFEKTILELPAWPAGPDYGISVLRVLLSPIKPLLSPLKGLLSWAGPGRAEPGWVSIKQLGGSIGGP